MYIDLGLDDDRLSYLGTAASVRKIFFKKNSLAGGASIQTNLGELMNDISW